MKKFDNSKECVLQRIRVSWSERVWSIDVINWPVTAWPVTAQCTLACANGTVSHPGDTEISPSQNKWLKVVKTFSFALKVQAKRILFSVAKFAVEMNFKYRFKFYELLACSLIASLLATATANNEVNSDIYDIGVGIADITGQAADVGMVITNLDWLFDVTLFIVQRILIEKLQQYSVNVRWIILILASISADGLW